VPCSGGLSSAADGRHFAGHLARPLRYSPRWGRQRSWTDNPAEKIHERAGHPEGVTPFPLSSDIKQVRSGLKKTAGESTKLDTPKSSKRLPIPPDSE
jgi:hypothetical protein